jgi:REP element-mobilizing transposase RayT
MPNHLHMIVFFHEQKESINNIIGTGKRFMAYEIVERLKMKKNIFILKKLEEGVNEIERRRGKLHQMFQPSFDLKALDTEKFLLQKINYIHNNPVSKKWNLVEDYRQYPFSSAGYYELGEVNGYEVTHYLEI